MYPATAGLRVPSLRFDDETNDVLISSYPLGCAALILAYPRSPADAVEPVVTRSVTRSTGEASGHHAQALRGALVDAQQHLAATGP